MDNSGSVYDLITDKGDSEKMPPPAYETGKNAKDGEISRAAASYGGKDFAAALACMASAYIFIAFALFHPHSVFSMAFNLIFLLSAVIYLRSKEVRFGRVHAFLFALSGVFNLPFILSDNNMIKVLGGIFSFALTSYAALTASNGKEAFGPDFPAAFMRSLFDIPFRGFSKFFGAFGSAFKKGSDKRKALQIILGAAVTLPLTIIVAALLAGADSGFGDMLEDIFSFIETDGVFETGVKTAFSIPVAAYLFGMIFINASRHNSFNDPDYKAFRFVPPLVAYSAVTPICILYVLFFFSQVKFYISAFMGVLPEGFSYAGYARQGFFELCAVSVINMGLILISNKRVDKTKRMRYNKKG